jgi:flagellar motor switch protein FliN
MTGRMENENGTMPDTEERETRQSGLGLPALSGENPPAIQEEWGARGQDAVMRIPVSVRFVLGSAKMTVAKLMTLKRGSIIQLDRKVGDPVDIVVNDRTVARGEVVVLDGDPPRFGISIKQVIQSRED